ncbi:hypothetical protein J6590_057486 [Homalodisca vitripennis]|nr:hypothetical protein J6590_093486 [Homalodisca vitripennis]KAG8301228.1 hypothetical protein J6590_057483 [Homalodisca vitripennis]KAG8301231.1 hypothetical protein J6590_057486 [Homalodisca vitripennis]
MEQRKILGLTLAVPLFDSGWGGRRRLKTGLLHCSTKLFLSIGYIVDEESNYLVVPSSEHDAVMLQSCVFDQDELGLAAVNGRTS